MTQIFCIGVISLSELLTFGQKHFRFDLSNWGFLVGLLGVLFALTALAPRPCRAVAFRIDLALRILSRNKWRAFVLSGGLPLAIGLVTIWSRGGFPVPSVHDEFSYLLAAETFASGRLTNPPFPVWVPFETFHVNPQPYYISMYPPGQGLLLALGIAIFGHPWFGVLLSVSMLGALTLWALTAWFPRRWALAGALATGVIASFSYWMTSYWGGALAACGGALVTGAIRRLMLRPTARDGVLFALGVVVLANTRMYEGAVLSAVCVTGLAVEWRKLDWNSIVRRVAPSAAAVIVIGAAWTFFYCWKTTGSPLELPYLQNLKTYHFRPMFVFEDDKASPQYHHEVMRRLYRDEFQMDAGDPRRVQGLALETAWHFGGSLLLIPLALLPWLIRDGRIRHLMLIGLTVTCFSLLPVWIRPHYLAPAMPAWIGITIYALRHVHAARWGNWRPGLFPVRALLGIWISLTFVRKSVAFTLVGLGGAGVVDIAKLKAGFVVSEVPEWALRRDRMEKALSAAGGKHLVLVRYSPTHNVHDEWVYNHANWESAPVLWAREMDEVWNSRLTASLPGRRVWILEADALPKPVLRPFDAGDGVRRQDTTARVVRGEESRSDRHARWE